MSIPRIDLLIKDSRIASLETDYGEEYGINQEFFRVALNKASVLAQKHLVKEGCEAFSTYKDYDIAAESEYVATPTDIFMHNLIYEVRYSPSGNEGDLGEPLEPMTSRGFQDRGEPMSFFPDGPKIWFDTIVSSGMFRVRYERCVETLDFRRGTVASFTGTAPDVTTIVLADDSWLEVDGWDPLPEYVTVVDYTGAFKMKNIPVLSYDAVTRTITARTSFVGETGESIAAGDYVCFGLNASSHSSLPSFMQLFFIQFIQDEVNDILSSDDQKSYAKRGEYLNELAELYAQLPTGFISIPQINRRGF